MKLEQAVKALEKYANGTFHERGKVLGSSFYGQKRGGYGVMVTFEKNGKETTYWNCW